MTNKINKNRMNHENWGRLLKTWVTGDDYFAAPRPNGTLPPAGDKYPRPTTVAELIEVATKAQAFNRDALAETITHVKLVQIEPDPDGTLVIRLPTKAMIRDVEHDLKKSGNEYGLPKFYADMVEADPDKPKAVEDKLRFHTARIGEYTIQNCQ
jgi:hypothetical protein